MRQERDVDVEKKECKLMRDVFTTKEKFLLLSLPDRTKNVTVRERRKEGSWEPLQ